MWGIEAMKQKQVFVNFPAARGGTVCQFPKNLQAPIGFSDGLSNLQNAAWQHIRKDDVEFIQPPDIFGLPSCDGVAKHKRDCGIRRKLSKPMKEAFFCCGCFTG